MFHSCDITTLLRMNRLSASCASALALVLAGCGSSGSSSPKTDTSPGASINPADFTGKVTNPYFPLTPGTTFVYRGARDGKPMRDVLTVTGQTKVIEGVPCVVIHDVVYLSGRLAERTTDWYTQDKQGNAWYFGESTAEFDPNGKVTTTEGTWRAGVDGAEPGIFMPAHPKIGQSFVQELYPGHAEDHFQVLSLSATVGVPYTTSIKALLTKEWTPLEPGVIDHKLYVRGIGTVKEETVKGGRERAVLVDVRRR
jgi:hypothetical protein